MTDWSPCWPTEAVEHIVIGGMAAVAHGSAHVTVDLDIVYRHRRERGPPRQRACYDNAAMESWFSTVKAELGETFGSIRKAKDQLFDYIEAFYNQRRRHSSIGYRSPAQHEKHYRATLELMAG